jgi:hypothetical protein
MTLLLSWASFDDGKSEPAAIYIAADSRISWASGEKWDWAQKVFCSPASAEVFGYCGDVMCVTQTLSQIVSLSNLEAFSPSLTPVERIELYCSLLRQTLKSYPATEIVSASAVIYATRFENRYHVYEIKIGKDAGITYEAIVFSKNKDGHSSKTRPDRIVRGSGTSNFNIRSPSETSYQAFHRFCDCLESGAVSSVGGAPQVVTIRRNGDCLLYGISLLNENRVLGLPVTELEKFSGITEWKNENFERWDPVAQKRTAGAQAQPRFSAKKDNRKLP